MSLEAFKNKVKNLLAILGVIGVITFVLGATIGLVIFGVFVYIYFLQKEIYTKIKIQYNSIIESFYNVYGKNIDLEKYRK